MLEYTLAIRNPRMGVVGSACDGQRLMLYTGPFPSPISPATGLLLAMWALPSPFSFSLGGTLSAFPINSVMYQATGRPGYFRIISGLPDNGNNTLVQGTAGVGYGDLNFANFPVINQAAAISSIVVAEGNA